MLCGTERNSADLAIWTAAYCLSYVSGAGVCQSLSLALRTWSFAVPLLPPGTLSSSGQTRQQSNHNSAE